MKSIKFLLAVATIGSLLACQNQSAGVAPANQEKDYNSLAISMAPSVVFEIPVDLGADCNFNNGVVLNSSSAIAYQNSSVPFGQNCVSETRVCQDGILSGSFNYGSCAVAAPVSCQFDGQTIAHGQSVNAYVMSAVASGQVCAFEVRTCNNGALTGSFNYSSCVVDQPASCLFNGQTIASGRSVSAFTTSSVPFGQSCVLEYRTCTDGMLSGSNTFASCNVDQPASCLFNGVTVANGESVTAFVNSTASFGTTCGSEVRTCDNGVLSGVYQFASCEVNKPASCLFNGQTIAHGAGVNAFASSIVNYGELCAVEMRICDNGHLSGTNQYASCDPGQAASCLFNGQTVNDGASINAYASSSVPASGTCSVEIRSCSNGVLSGSNAYAGCQVDRPASCLFDGQTIAHQQSVLAYRTATVALGQVCEAESRVCVNGSLSGSYPNRNCTVRPNSNDDRDKPDDDLIKICKLVVQIKKKENSCDKMNKIIPHAETKYKERYNCGKHLGWYKESHKENRSKCGHNSDWYHDKEAKK